MLRISRLKVTGFRSCNKLSFDLGTSVTCLIGPNGAGKTNILQAIQLLKRDTLNRYRDNDETPDVKCEVSVSLSDQKDKTKIIDHRSKISLGSSRNNSEEILKKEDKWSFKGYDWNKSIHGLEFDLLNDRKNPKLSLNSKILSWERHLYRSSFLIKSRSVKRNTIREELHDLFNAPETVRTAASSSKDILISMQYCTASQFTNPLLSPTSFEIDEEGDLRDAYTTHKSDHVRLIFRLYKLMKSDPKGYMAFLNVVGDGGLKVIRDIDWQEKEFSTTAVEVRSAAKVINKTVKRKIVIPIVSVNNSKLSFNQLSEGTFRVIALLYYILSKNNRLLLIEEPEVGIHHGLLESIVEVIKSVASRKQIIFSTHSSAVVDQMDPESICLVSNDATNGTTARKLTNSLAKNDYAALKQFLKDSGNLGDYWRSGGFEEWR